MCGIFGMITTAPRQPDKTTVRKATHLLQHRGPDGAGFYYDQNLALGHRRLAIIDLSEQGKQPMEAFGYVISYNGEIYNYLELRVALEKEGYRFASESDTEVILAAYAHWGEDCLRHFNGMWALAIYDPEKRSLFCARDRYGIKPFYYTMLQGDFCFASEIKAFKALEGWKFQVNSNAVADFLLAGQQHQGRETFYESVLQLLPGHALHFDLQNHRFQEQAWYDLEQVSSLQLSPNDAAEQFRELFNSAIALHLRSDVPVGTAFSGGLDSSAILATVYQNFPPEASGSLEAVSYLAKDTPYDESRYVDAFQKQYPAQIHRIAPDFSQLLQHMDTAIQAHDEPLLSASLLAQFAVFQAAHKQGLKVMLDGQGADELLAGYGTYYPPFFRYLLSKRPLRLLPELMGMLWYHHLPWGRLLPTQSTGALQGILLKPSVGKLAASRDFSTYVRQMIQSHHLPRLLHFEDRNSMAHSIEARVPFLDFRLVEFCLALAPELHIRGGKRKALLRKAMSEFLPKPILHRYDKLGFVAPQSPWMEQHPEQMLDRLRESMVIFPSIFDQQWLPWVNTVLQKKQRQHYSLLWRAMTLLHWKQLNE